MKVIVIFGKFICNFKILFSKLIFFYRNMFIYYKFNIGNIKLLCGLCVFFFYCCFLEFFLNDYKCINFRYS